MYTAIINTTMTALSLIVRYHTAETLFREGVGSGIKAYIGLRIELE
jgi:hypothetical protein